MFYKRKIPFIIGVLLMGMPAINVNKVYGQKGTAQPADLVNVFLGTSGDHGQLSPAASYPFSMLSIVPQTSPWIHTGYEYYAKEFLGFAHTVFEGVGCEGSGANLLIKPFTGNNPDSCTLMKVSEDGHPGYYSVGFKNGLTAAFTVGQREGIHHYRFPERTTEKNLPKGLVFDLAHTRANRFYREGHLLGTQTICGWIEAGTTCSAGKYRVYYAIHLNQAVRWDSVAAHKLVAHLNNKTELLELRIGWSSTSIKDARQAIDRRSFSEIKKATRAKWNNALSRIQLGLNNPAPDSVQRARSALFYSLLYRVIQSPYMISERDGRYRNTLGQLKEASTPHYSGWSVWDNYRTQLPLLSLVYGNRYQDIVNSLAELYNNGKKDYATFNEPVNTVRTEHTDIVLLDAFNKGYSVDFNQIIDSMQKEVDGLVGGHPDKALENSYDNWALSQVYKILGQQDKSEFYRHKTLEYKKVWRHDFADLSKKDVDRMGARGMYQGTIWQYRWLVPYDMQGLTKLIGSKSKLEQQLDRFFQGDYYSQANEPDIAAPLLYNITAHPSKAQALLHKYAVDTVTQFYFNGNSRGINPIIGPVYRNQPRAFLPTMDDDGGAMSGWFVFASIGLFPACVGSPVYYLHVPLFEDLKLQVGRSADEKRVLHIHVKNFHPGNVYIQKIIFNGKVLHQNYLLEEQIRKGGELVVYSSDKPFDDPRSKQWMSAVVEN